MIHGRCWFLPKALREMGNWVAHKAHGPTPVALQSRENELSFLVLDDAKFRALVWSFGPTSRDYFEGAVLQQGYIPSADAMLEYVAVHRAVEAVQALQRARETDEIPGFWDEWGHFAHHNGPPLVLRRRVAAPPTGTSIC